MDSNHRRRKPADLQSAPVGHLGNLPGLFRSGVATHSARFSFGKAYVPDDLSQCWTWSLRVMERFRFRFNNCTFYFNAVSLVATIRAWLARHPRIQGRRTTALVTSSAWHYWRPPCCFWWPNFPSTATTWRLSKHPQINRLITGSAPWEHISRLLHFFCSALRRTCCRCC